MNWKFIVRLIFSAVLLAILFYSFDWQEVAKLLLKIDSTWLLAAFAWIVAAIAVSVIKWNLILQALGFTLSWKQLWDAYWIGIFFNNFLPSSFGGDAARILYTGKETGDYPGISLSVIAERILATVALALIGLVSSLWLGFNVYNIVWLFVLLLGLSLALLAVLLSGRLPGVFSRKNSGTLATFLQKLAEQGKLLRSKRGKLWWALIWSIAFQFANVAVNYAIFRGLQVDYLPFHELLAVIPATAAIAMVPLAVNGYGIREGAYVLLLAPFGINETIALSTSLLYAFSISLLSLWGGFLWLLHRRKETGHVENRSCQDGRKVDERGTELL